VQEGSEAAQGQVRQEEAQEEEELAIAKCAESLCVKYVLNPSTADWLIHEGSIKPSGGNPVNHLVAKDLKKAVDARIKQRIEELATRGEVVVECADGCECHYGPAPDKWSPEKKPQAGVDPDYEYSDRFTVKKGTNEKTYEFKFDLLAQWKRIEGRCRPSKGHLPDPVQPADGWREVR
jgi:hypothetical protein